MGQLLVPGNPPITVLLRRTRSARRMSLRISRLDGRVTLTLPAHVPDGEARAFVHTKEAWLRKHLAAQATPVHVSVGASVPIGGVLREVVPGRGRQVVLGRSDVAVPGPAAQSGARLEGWLKARARDRLAEASDLYSNLLGRPYARLTLRDTRSRWGSCTADGRLMYSWRLILAPPEVLDYVAAHEVAHLQEMNHSQRFWDVVHALYGDWKPMRAWLAHEGAALHLYRF